MDDFKQLFEERRSILDGKATQYREERDSWNEKTKELVSQRNEFNSEVRELIQLSDQQKQVREQMNQVVREKKGVRNEASKRVAEIRDKLRSDEPSEEKPAERGLEDDENALLLSNHFSVNSADLNVNSNEVNTLERTKERS